MIKQFISHSITYGAATILSRGIMIFLVPLYTRLLSPEDYGALDILNIVGGLVSLIVTLEISQGYARFLPEATGSRELTEYASTMLWYVLCSYAIFLVFAFLYCDDITMLLMGSVRWKKIVKLAICSVAINGTFLVLTSQLRWQLKTYHYNVVSLFTVIATSAVAVILTLLFEMGVSGIIIGQIVGSGLGGWMSWYMTRKSFALIINLSKLKLMLRYSMPLVLSSVNVYLSLYLDRIAIKHFMTLNDVGIYGVAYRLASVVGVMSSVVTMSLTPLIYNNYKSATTPEEILKLFKMFLLIALWAIIMLALFSYEAISLLTTHSYLSSWTLIPVISAAILFSSMYIFMPGMDIEKKTRTIAFINIMTGFVNIILNILLVPMIGVMGAAIATLISSLLMFVIYAYNSQQYYYIPYQWRKIALTIFMCILASMIIITVVPDKLLLKIIVAATAMLLMSRQMINQSELQAIINLLISKKREC